jgi:hypothetical protein
MGDYIKPKIFGYDKTIYKFIEKYKNNDFKEKYKAKIKALNQEILNSNNNDNIISYLLNNDERNKLFFQNGGNKYMFETGEELYNMSAHDLSERDFMFDENKISNTYNVLVIGGGPIGLFNAIILKTYMPELDIKIIEKRQINGKRKLEREQIIKTGLYLSTTNTEYLNNKQFFSNLRLDYDNIHYDNIHADNGFILIPKKYWKYPFFNINISLNMLEFKLSNIAEEIGISIVQSSIEDTTFLISQITDKTLAIFDATGGRLNFNKPIWTKEDAPTHNCKYVIGQQENLKPNYQGINEKQGNRKFLFQNSLGLGFYYYICDDNKEINIKEMVDNEKNVKQGDFTFKAKGLNKNSVNEIENIPLISIGDSMHSADFTTGSGIAFGFIHCILCALLFKQQYNKLVETKGGSKKSHKKKLKKSIKKKLKKSIKKN